MLCSNKEMLGLRRRADNEKINEIKKNLDRLIKNETMDMKKLKYCITPDILNSFDIREFFGFETISKYLVDDVLLKALPLVNGKLDCMSWMDIQYDYDPWIKIPEKFKWPNIEDIKTTQLIDLIKRYVNLWDLEHHLKFHVRYLSTEITDLTTIYHIEVVFSAPNPSCPCPLITASCYFTIECSRVIPASSQVYVTYRFEGFDTIELADERFSFQQNLIMCILSGKLKLFYKMHDNKCRRKRN